MWSEPMFRTQQKKHTHVIEETYTISFFSDGFRKKTTYRDASKIEYPNTTKIAKNSLWHINNGSSTHTITIIKPVIVAVSYSAQKVSCHFLLLLTVNFEIMFHWMVWSICFVSSSLVSRFYLAAHNVNVFREANSKWSTDA